MIAAGNPIDVDAVRADTPGCRDVVHFNNCGSSLPPDPVLDTMIDYLRLEARIGGYEAVEASADDFDRVYRAGAEMLGCAPSELAFTSGSSEAWWRAFLSVPLEPGDRVLIGRTEYSANAVALLQAAERGVKVEVVPDDADGQISLDVLDELLDERVKLVCLTSIAMTNGLVNPTAEVGAQVKAAGAYFLVDACQAVGQMPIDVDALRCDFLTFTGRKFMRAPRGTGMLYARSSILDDLVTPTFIDGRSSIWTSTTDYRLQDGAQRFELVEVSYGAKLGFGRAIDYALELGLDAIEVRVTALAERLRAALADIDGVRVLDTGRRRCGIVTFDLAGVAPAEVSAELRRRGINTGAPDAPGSRLDLEGRSLEAVVRAGVHYYNTDDEVDRFAAEVASIGAGR